MSRSSRSVSRQGTPTTRRAFLRRSAAAVSLLVGSSVGLSWMQAMAAEEAPEEALAAWEPDVADKPMIDTMPIKIVSTDAAQKREPIPAIS